MIPVKSSNLAAVGYDTSSQTLRVEFLTPSLYEYDGVPSHVHQGLMNAASHGSYFAANIRDKYTFRQLK